MSTETREPDEKPAFGNSPSGFVGKTSVPLPPELRDWALHQHQHTEEDILAVLREVQEKGGTEMGEVIKRLKQKRKNRAL
jgi:hypothetical protein